MNAPVTGTEDLLYTVEDGIAKITFNRPQARNALTFAMYEQMASICETINGDRSIKALILTGAGDKAFASGTDISQFRAFKTAQDALDYEARIDRVLGTLEQCRVPVIAAIAGACTGGGAGIAARCSAALRRASASIAGAKSIPVTRCPREASSRLRNPVPQPASSTSSALRPASTRPKIRSHATRSAAVRMLCPKSSSKCAARRPQWAATCCFTGSVSTALIALPPQFSLSALGG